MPSRPDRFEQGLDALRQTPVPDQQDEISQRTDGRGDKFVALDHPGGGMGYIRRRWPVMVGAAAVILVVVGVAAYMRADSPDVSTDEPTRAGEAIEPGAAPPAEANDASGSCREISLTSSSPPGGIDASSSAPIADEPRAPQTIRPDVIGLFTGDTTTRVVLVVAGWPDLAGELGAETSGPFPDTTSRLGSYDDGWYAQISVPTGSGSPCPTTLVGVGLTETDLRQLVDGLTLRP